MTDPSGDPHRYRLPGGQELRAVSSDHACHLTLPGAADDANRWAAALSALASERRIRYRVEPAGADGFSVDVDAPDGDLDRLLTSLSARVYAYPDPGVVDWREFRNAPDPVLSCVVLLTANDAFVRRQLVPSIVATTADVPVEIIVVANGPGLDLEPFAHLHVVTSDEAWVSRGYNRGAQVARGAYLAFFHDDCALDGPGWFERSRSMLDHRNTAVTPEIQPAPVGPGLALTTAKATPLVLRRSDFFDLGGFDEFYYAGLEDQDFTYRILASGGRIGRLDVPYRHYNGMSTVIMFAGRRELFRTLFGHALLPQPVIDQVRSVTLRAMTADPVVNALQTQNLVYLLRKYATHFEHSGRPEMVRLGDQLQGQIGRDVLHRTAVQKPVENWT